jgi:sulfopyruvate decarboxylase TPP-binding subunit
LKETAPAVRGSDLVNACKQAGVEFVLSVPDIVTSAGMLFPIAGDPTLRLFRVCKEDEAIGMSAGLAACGRRSLVLIQHTGFLDSINAIRAVSVEYRQPTVMLIGLLGLEAGAMPADSKKYGVRIVVPILEAMQIRYRLIGSEGDADILRDEIEHAYTHGEPVALLVTRSPLA